MHFFADAGVCDIDATNSEKFGKRGLLARKKLSGTVGWPDTSQCATTFLARAG
jgi:hypothetical protein